MLTIRDNNSEYFAEGWGIKCKDCRLDLSQILQD